MAQSAEISNMKLTNEQFLYGASVAALCQLRRDELGEGHGQQTVTCVTVIYQMYDRLSCDNAHITYRPTGHSLKWNSM